MSLYRDPVILMAFAFAFAARLAFVGAISSEDFPHNRYLGPASEFIRGKWFTPLSADQLPGAPLFFAFCMLFTGKNFSALAAVQHALGLATWYMVVRVASRTGGVRAARWTAWLLAVQLILPYQERFIFSEATAHFLLAAALNAAVGLREDREAGPGRFAFAGWVAAMAALTRGEFLVLGPLLAAALALPRQGRTFRRLGVFAAAWTLTIGGWLAHNRLAGCNGFNALGSSILIDYALPLVRYDLPSNALAKGILREETAACAASGGCGSVRLQAVERLYALSGPGRDYESLFRARFSMGEIAHEAILTQPVEYISIVWNNFRKGFSPIPWINEEQLTSGSAVLKSRTMGGWRANFWSALEHGFQYFGWAPILLILLAPLGLWGAWPKNVWTLSLMTAIIIGVIGALAPADMSARLQSSIYLPLCILGGLSAEFLTAGLQTAWARIRSPAI